LAIAVSVVVGTLVSRHEVGLIAQSPLDGQGKTGHLSTLQNRPFPVSGIEAE
jgi:hypothetical protein